MAAFLLLAAAFGLSPAPSLELRVGETAELGGMGRTLTFDEVRSDSRCPADAACIAAGEAILVLTAADGSSMESVAFAIPPGGSDAKDVLSFRITVESLEPPNQSGRAIPQHEYLARVRVEELEPGRKRGALSCGKDLRSGLHWRSESGEPFPRERRTSP